MPNGRQRGGFNPDRMADLSRAVSIVPQIVNIVSQDAELRVLAVREPTLDEIFLQLTGTALRD